MSAPVKEPETGQLMGVVAVGIDPGALSALTTGKRVLAEGAETQSFRMGETGETYIVNRNALLLTESRFLPNSILALKVETVPVRSAVERGKEIMADYKDYRGVTVSGASSIIADMGWVLVTEIDFSQAFAPINVLRNLLIGMAIMLGLLAVFIARDFAKRIVNPLQLTSEADRALAAGEEQGAIVPDESLAHDEIGEFIRKRNTRVRELFERENELLREQKLRADAATALQGISYSMVHDMRAPLRTIIAFGDLIIEEAAGRLTETETSHLARMKTASLRMDRLICDMLRYSSLLHADLPLSPVNLTDLLRKVVAQNRLLNVRKGDIALEEKMPLIRGNATVLTQCFTVLLDNAVRYARPGVTPKVRVWAESNGSWTRLIVEDNGVGISEQFRQRVFGIFQKGTNSQEGTGIGLALVRVAVERMGGHVGVKSEEGKGSQFWIELRVDG
jgi:signal transduction histidine kinase